MTISGNWSAGGRDPLARLGSIDRRRFLAMSGAGAAALVLGGGPYTERALAASRVPDGVFRLGVASGDPTPSGVVLWTRLAPEPHAKGGAGGMPSRRVDVRWEVATDEAFTRVVRRGTAAARPELAHSVHVEMEGLSPGRQYFYRFRAGSDTSPVGRTATAPPRDRLARELRFAVASCQMYEHGYYTAYRHMAQEDLDLVLFLGDYIYEYGPRDYALWSGAVRLHDSPEVKGLAEYRNRHALYRADADLQAAHAAFPWVVTWDDHDVSNNYASSFPDDESRMTPANFLLRRAAAYQAFYEHMPLRRQSVPQGPNMRLYRTLSWGELATFRVLDTRQYRDDQANGDGSRPPDSDSRDPSRSLLGGTQERWLASGLASSRARWDVLAQQVFFARADIGSGRTTRVNMDAWDGYEATRTRALAAIEGGRTRNAVVLTGDVHANWANEVRRDAADPDSKRVATEFVGTSISTGGNGSDVRADTARIRSRNPHIRFFNAQRGYMHCRVTPSQWRTAYRVLERVSRPGSPISTRAAFVVEDGRPALARVDSGPRTAATAVSAETEGDRIRAEREAER